MKKIISLFARNYDGDRLIRDEVVPGAEWVLAGEGVATVKWDGTAVLIKEGRPYARYDAKQGKAPPPGFIPAQANPDPVTSHWPGWVSADEGPQHMWIREAFCNSPESIADGTYEAVGPNIQANPYGLPEHILVLHGGQAVDDVPRDFVGLREWFASYPSIEGIVWHHPDGRMVKIKRRDFGLLWPTRG